MKYGADPEIRTSHIEMVQVSSPAPEADMKYATDPEICGS